MKKVQKVILLLSACCCLGLFMVGCNSMSARAYKDEARPLPEVAVLISNPHTCPVFTIDGQYKDLKRKPGTEIHLLPGEHSVEIFYQAEGDWISPFLIKETSLTHTFKAGHVYAVCKTENPCEDLVMYQSKVWTPHIQDLGDVVTFAAQHLKYKTNAQEWKTLRKENGLTKSFFDYFKFAKDRSSKQIHSY
jgi:hypothetical protein